MYKFSERLTEALQIRDTSAADLARKIGVNEGTISNYKSGRYAPKQKRIEEIANALNVQIAWLMGADVPITKPQEQTSPIPKALNILPIPKTKLLPVLGTIACGEPILAEENIEAYFPTDDKMKADFCLKCKGDSMVNAHIFDGDIVYIKKQPDVDNGQIAAVLIGEEATLKKVYKYPDKLVLSPCNPLYDDLVYRFEELENISIIGKAIAYTGVIKYQP